METGVIYCGDNLPRLAQLPAESVDLIYLDPPFFSNRQYEVIWGDEAEVRSFEDRWQGGINVYVNWMCERVLELRRVLKHTGSLYLHCDPHASHYLKVMLDEIFGSENFRNEIVWKRTYAHGSSRRYGPVHDVLLFYAGTDRYTWNMITQAHGSDYLRSKYRFKDHRGTYRLIVLTAPGRRQGESGSEWRGYDPSAVGRHWAVPKALIEMLIGPEQARQMSTQQKLQLLDDHGYIYWTPRGKGGGAGVPQLKQYQGPGMPLQDVITDIPPINSQAKERLGYPTQKPEALLARIIEASSSPGDVLLDRFAGCGTALVTAQRLGRRWVGIDISPTACEMMRRRMLKIGATDIRLLGMPVSVEALRRLKPFEFQNWVIQRFNGTHSPRKSGDMGIDGYSFFLHEPIQVKQSDSIGRPVVDSFETAVQRSGKQKGYIVGFSFTRGAREEAARAKRALGLEIELVTVNELLGDATSLLTPVGRRHITSVPLPPPRPRNTLPSADDLIQSDLQTA